MMLVNYRVRAALLYQTVSAPTPVAKGSTTERKATPAMAVQGLPRAAARRRPACQHSSDRCALRAEEVACETFQQAYSAAAYKTIELTRLELDLR
jgi:hypothetical protein